MREQIEERLTTLRKEHEAGRRMLAELEAQQLELRQTLLRIGGAVQVLEELLATEEPAAGDGAPENTANGTGAVDGRVPAGAAAG